MKISAQISNQKGSHEVVLKTNGQSHSIDISPKASGYGSSANGGELLFLALATCYCNDIYREAMSRNIQVERVTVEVTGDFGGLGDPATNIVYRSKVCARASESAIRELMRYTDRVAEIQNTLRSGVAVRLGKTEAEPL